jgi:hypothetical protein
MLFRRVRHKQSDSPFALEELGAALDAAVDKFGREWRRHLSRRTAGQSRSIVSARLSTLPPNRRPYRAHGHPLRLPQRHDNRVPSSILSNQRRQIARAPWVRESEARAQGWFGRLRQRLLNFRQMLQRLRDRFRISRPPRRSVR